MTDFHIKLTIACDVVVTKLSIDTSISVSCTADAVRSISLARCACDAVDACGGDGVDPDSEAVGIVKRRCLEHNTLNSSSSYVSIDSY